MELNINPSESLTFRYPVESEGLLRQWIWVPAKGEYTCLDGVIQFPVVLDLGGSEGPDGNSQRKISMGKAADGSPIFYEQFRLAKPSIRKRGLPKFWVYRFERIDIE